MGEAAVCGLAVLLSTACGGGSDEPAGASGSTGGAGATIATTSGDDSSGDAGSSGDSGGSSGSAEACEPPALTCLDPGAEQPGCAPSVSDRRAAFTWALQGQGANTGTCTTTFDESLTFACEGASLTLTLHTAAPIEAFDWQPDDPVVVSWSSSFIYGGADDIITVADASTGELLLEAVQLAWSEPLGDGDPIAVSAVREVCCGAQDNVGLRFELGESDAAVLYANARAELTNAAHTYAVHVGESWVERCPPPGAHDVRVSGFSYVIVREP